MKKRLDAEMQQLKAEYKRKIYVNICSKEKVNARKREAMQKAHDTLQAERTPRLAKIMLLRTEMATLTEGDPKTAVLKAEISNLETEITILRNENDQRIHNIVNGAYRELSALNTERRMISARYEDDKSKLLKEFGMN